MFDILIIPVVAMLVFGAVKDVVLPAADYVVTTASDLVNDNTED